MRTKLGLIFLVTIISMPAHAMLNEFAARLLILQQLEDEKKEQLPHPIEKKIVKILENFKNFVGKHIKENICCTGND